MDQIFGTIGSIRVAVFFFADAFTVNIGVYKLEVYLVFDQRIILSKILDQSVGMTVVYIYI